MTQAAEGDLHGGARQPMGLAPAPWAPAAPLPRSGSQPSLFNKPPEGLTFLSGQSKSFFFPPRHIKKIRLINYQHANINDI